MWQMHERKEPLKMLPLSKALGMTLVQIRIITGNYTQKIELKVWIIILVEKQSNHC